MSEVVRTNTIEIAVGLDKDNIPTEINWKANDNPDGPKDMPGKALMLGVFDRDSKDTLRIDLWTKDMQVHEMDRFVYQSLRAMADTYYKATRNAELATAMQQFVQYFGEKTEILPKPS